MPDKPIRKDIGSSNPREPDKEEISISNIVNKINLLHNGLRDYDIRQLVTEAKYIGEELHRHKLKTNQIRKFLDAINRIKASVILHDLMKDDNLPSNIKDEIIMLQPKLAYAAAKKNSKSDKPDPEIQAAKMLQDVLTAATNKIYQEPDFQRLVQLIESIIAYHKSAGGE
jgi:CRISPR-associated protein Csm2